MSDAPLGWQVKVTPHDRGDLDVVMQRLESVDLRSLRRRRALLLGARTEHEGAEIVARISELPLPRVEVRVERVGRVRGALQAWFHGGAQQGGADLGDAPSSWSDGGGGGGGGGDGGGGF
jgi:hypothetical protein